MVNEYITITYFLRHTGISCTSSFTKTTVTSLSTRLCVLADAGTRMHGNGLLDYQTILDHLTDVLSWNSNMSENNIAPQIVAYNI